MSETIDTQGRSRYTRDKELAFAAVINSVFKASKTAIGGINSGWGTSFPFHFVDLFAGSGINTPRDGGEAIEGTPLISARNLSVFSESGVKVNPFFVEYNKVYADLLGQHLTERGFSWLTQRVRNCDAQEFLPKFANHVAHRERASKAIGLLLLDPNTLYRGYSQRHKMDTGIQLGILREFMLTFERIDVLLRIDLRFHRQVVGHVLKGTKKVFLSQVMPVEFLLGAYFKKAYWSVSQNGPNALIAFGSNHLKHIWGLEPAHTDNGQNIIRSAEGGKNAGWSYNPLTGDGPFRPGGPGPNPGQSAPGASPEPPACNP